MALNELQPRMLYPVGFRPVDFAKSLITDGRFSGGSHGFVVGDITPEAYVGGSIVLVKDGDSITIDAENRQINLELTARMFKQRRQARKAPRPRYTRGAGEVCQHGCFLLNGRRHRFGS
jgi:dihydroxyacid dehydratase/phosphogluconate dehydratase